MIDAEKLLEHAEAVRIAYGKERNLRRLERKIEAGHGHLAEYRDRLAAALGRRA